MEITEFTADQLALLQMPFNQQALLSGPAGSGKTTVAVARLKEMTGNGIPARSILVLVPQRSLGIPYVNAIQSPAFPAGGQPTVVTLGGLAQRMISLFWPMVAREAGFSNPSRPPRFLTLEASQYYLSLVIQPLLQKGYFENITIDPNRLLSQILDNLNKSSVVGFPIHEIGERLKNAWVGPASQRLVYDQAQECALQFRAFCLKNNLLDFSLQFELFTKQLWQTLLCREYVYKSFRHLIYDNIEEDVPVAHDLVSSWLPHLESALLLQETQGGYRSFLGADPKSAEKLASSLPVKKEFFTSFVQSPPISQFQQALGRSLHEQSLAGTRLSEWEKAFEVQTFRFYPEMIDWAVEEIGRLIQKGVEPAKIAVLAPYLSDSLRFSLLNRFEKAQIPVKTFRPSRSLKDESIVRGCLCFAKLAYPHWHLAPTRFEVCQMFSQFLQDADLIRANLLAQTLFQPSKPEGPLIPFEGLLPTMQTRITYGLGERYEHLRLWLIEFRKQPVNELDIFFSRLFGELLSQPGFALHQNLEAASIIARLIESTRKFRQSLLDDDLPLQQPVGKEYVTLLNNGLIAAQSIHAWKQGLENNAVLIAPAFTFLMSNQPMDTQFWLDIGSHGWWSRLDQPLTQPYVLNRQWDPAAQWTEAMEFASNQASLERLLSGLLLRCSRKIYMAISSMNEQGDEERSELVNAIQTLRRAIVREKGEQHV